LDHVVKFPDFYAREGAEGQSVAVAAAGGYDKLVIEVQASLDALGSSRFEGIAIVADADETDPLQRLMEVRAQLDEVNRQGTSNGVDGFPLTLPATFAVQRGPGPRFGIYVLPDCRTTGTLETLLLECAASSYNGYYQAATDFVNGIDASEPPESINLRLLRRGSGIHKATANIIGNILHPGCSLGTAIERGKWLDGLTGRESAIAAARQFLNELLA
jgi:hypothetical protein